MAHLGPGTLPIKGLVGVGGGAALAGCDRREVGAVMSHEYEHVRRVVYGEEDSEYAGATFVPVCAKCFRFVRPDTTMRFQNYTVAPGPNAYCRKCGRTEMLFEGFL